MLVTLADMKTYLGIADTSYDAFLTEQLNNISEAIETYCGRVFASTAYTQTFYKDEAKSPYLELALKNFPVITLTSVIEDTTNLTADTRSHPTTGTIINKEGWFRIYNEVKVVYTAGFATIPYPIQSAVKSIVEEAYNKNKAGINLGFGNDVQSVSIPGVVNVQFDFSLQANERKTPMGMLLGNYLNIFDKYRTERSMIGSIGRNYA